MFADDLLAFISNPTPSIPALLGVLNEDGKISGFLTNETKSIAMMLFGEKPAILKEKIKFQWTRKGFRYVGVTITPMTSQLFRTNYEKLTRLSYKRLQSSKRDGGLNLPDLQKYYWETQLKTIMSWITEDTDTLWVEMEQNSCPVPLGYLPFMSLKEWKKLKLTNVWTEKTWKIWSKIRNKLGVSNSVSRVTKIAINPDFHPSRTDNGFKKWMNKGLVYIDQLFDGQVL